MRKMVNTVAVTTNNRKKTTHTQTQGEWCMLYQNEASIVVIMVFGARILLRPFIDTHTCNWLSGFVLSDRINNYNHRARECDRWTKYLAIWFIRKRLELNHLILQEKRLDLIYGRVAPSLKSHFDFQLR